MTKEQVIEKLIDQVNHNMDTFIGILGIVLAAFLYFQWRLSEKQIQKMKDSTKQELEEKYHFQEIINKINEIEKKIGRTEKKLIELNQNINNNRQKIDSVIQDENKKFADSLAADAKLDVDKKIMIARLQKLELESQANLFVTRKDLDESKKLADAMQTKIDKLMANKTFEPVIGSLSAIYRVLEKSNNQAANELATYLNKKYPIATYFIGLDNF